MYHALDLFGAIGLEHRVVLENAAYLTVGGLRIAHLLTDLFE